MSRHQQLVTVMVAPTPSRSNFSAQAALCTYTTDGDYYVLEAQADCVSNSNKTAAADVANDVGLIVTTRTKYFKVYDFDKATDLMSDDETVKQSFVSGVNDNSNTDWERYADKALVIDVEKPLTCSGIGSQPLLGWTVQSGDGFTIP